MAVVWSEEVYGTGVAEIDAQHQELFARVNAFLAACEGGHGAREVRYTLDFLTHYTVSHFLFEERWMRDRATQGAERNHHDHVDFIQRLDRFRLEFAQVGAEPALCGEFAGFLTRWISGHIERVDVPNLRPHP